MFAQKLASEKHDVLTNRILTGTYKKLQIAYKNSLLATKVSMYFEGLSGANIDRRTSLGTVVAKLAIYQRWYTSTESIQRCIFCVALAETASLKREILLLESSQSSTLNVRCQSGEEECKAPVSSMGVSRSGNKNGEETAVRMEDAVCVY